MTETDPKISRRTALAAAGTCFVMLSQKALAAETSAATPKASYAKENEADVMREITGIHQGKSTGKTKWFRFGNAAPWPAHFIVYDLPPDASEGVHVHFLDDRNKEGAFDRYYYIMSGQGQTEIDGKIARQGERPCPHATGGRSRRREHPPH